MLLAVDHSDAMLVQEVHQVSRCDLERVANTSEHRFVIKHLADADDISTADQFSIQPDLRLIGVIKSMHRALANHDSFRNSGAVVITARRRAFTHHLLKHKIEMYWPAAIAGHAALYFAQGLCAGWSR